MHYRSFIALLAGLLLLVNLAGCGNFLKPHRISIQQGNVVTPSMLAKLELGMSRRQVAYVLGTPLVVDTFSPDQWHYNYSYETGEGLRIERYLHLSFNDDALVNIETDIPTPKSTTQPADNASPAGQLLQKEQEKLEKSLPTRREDSERDAGL